MPICMVKNCTAAAETIHLSDGIDEHELDLCAHHWGRAQGGEDREVVTDDRPVVLRGENHPWTLLASSATRRTEPHPGLVLRLTLARRGEPTDLEVFVTPEESEVLHGMLNVPGSCNDTAPTACGSTPRFAHFLQHRALSAGPVRRGHSRPGRHSRPHARRTGPSRRPRPGARHPFSTTTSRSALPSGHERPAPTSAGTSTATGRRAPGAAGPTRSR